MNAIIEYNNIVSISINELIKHIEERINDGKCELFFGKSDWMCGKNNEELPELIEKLLEEKNCKSFKVEYHKDDTFKVSWNKIDLLFDKYLSNVSDNTKGEI